MTTTTLEQNDQVSAAPRARGLRLGGSAAFIVSHRKLLLRATKTDLRQRYAGSFLGLGWVALGPAAILGLYALIYLKVFKIVLPSLSGMEYVLFIFSGLAPFLAMAEATASSATAVVANKAVLSNTVYPIDLTPVNSVLTSCGTLAVGFGAILIWGGLIGALHTTVVLLPVILLLFIIGLIGVGWLVSILNVVMRDLQNMIQVAIMCLLIASPLAFTPDQVPSSLKLLILLNPFAYYVRAFQDVTILGTTPSPLHWLALVVLSFGAFFLGSWAFSRTKGVVVDYV